MRYYIPILLISLLLPAQPVTAGQAGRHPVGANNCRTHDRKMNCDGGPDWCKDKEGFCSPEMRGRCGKRRGDWYGASQSVANAAEARSLLLNYFSGLEYTISEVTEKKWGFRAEVIDRNGKVIDRIMIDKRSGRIRSLY